MEFPKALLIRFFTETMGLKYLKEEGDFLWFEEGLNKVVVAAYFRDIYEEAELYKQVGALLAQDAAKTYLAALPEALAFVDVRFFKNHGVGLVVVDPSRGVEGVEIKIYAKPRQASSSQVDVSKIAESLKAALSARIDEELKRLEKSLFEKVKAYVDQRLEELRRRQEVKPPEPQQARPAGPIVDNEWVRILRSKT